MPSIFKNTRLAWLTEDIAEDYALESDVNQATTNKSSPENGNEQKFSKTEKNVAWVIGLNSLGLCLNSIVTYGIGMWGLFDFRTLQELYHAHPTLVTPNEWAFYIWHVIFAAQLVWFLVPICYSDSRDSAYLHQFANYYLCLSVFQAGWVLSFSYDILWLSAICMLLNLGTLLTIFQRIYRVELSVPPIEIYSQWFLPFTLHLGWIMPMTLCQILIFLDWIADDIDETVQLLCVGLGSFFVFFMAILFIHLSEFVVPSVVVATFVSIYLHLNQPEYDAELEGDFTQAQLDFVKFAHLAGAVILAFWVLIQVWSMTVDQILDAQDVKEKQAESEGKTFDSQYVAPQV